MLCSRQGTQEPTISDEEKKCAASLVNMHKQLEKIDGCIVTYSDAGSDNCIAFLDALEICVQTLKVNVASRSYRDFFTPNYRFLFPDSGLHYRIDVFDSSMKQQDVVWVNGEQFEFNHKTIANAKALQEALAHLYTLLDDEDEILLSPSQHVQVLRLQLAQLDTAWANYERSYISELIAIEATSKNAIVQAIEEEAKLHRAERRKAAASVTHGSLKMCSIQVREHRRKLVACINNLNSVANNQGKGRSDLDASILEEAEQRLRGHKEGGSSNDIAAGMLAREIVDSFNAMRTYFDCVSTSLERVDPHLCNNPGLVNHLSVWEESWEIGAKYVRDESLFNAIVAVVEELRKIGQLVPAFKDMCIDCDVELFLCIPRLIWLHYLRAPAECRELLRMLLPHRFRSSIDLELKRLEDCFRQLQQFFELLAPTAQQATSLWDLLIRRALAGSNGSADLNDHSDAATKLVCSAVDTFMREVEPWSIELQRNSADDWNLCCSLLVRCLAGCTKTATEVTEGQFHV